MTTKQTSEENYTRTWRYGAYRPRPTPVGSPTYMREGSLRDGWLYLAVLLDLFSRRIVGWAISDRIDTELAALQMAVRTRRPPRGRHVGEGAAVRPTAQEQSADAK